MLLLYVFLLISVCFFGMFVLWFVLPCFVSLFLCFVVSLRALLFSFFFLLTCANSCRVQGGMGWDGAFVKKGFTKIRLSIGHCTFTKKVTKLGSILNHFIH